jgi:hypothetical protein
MARMRLHLTTVSFLVLSFAAASPAAASGDAQAAQPIYFKPGTYIRFNEQPDANTTFSSPAIFLKGKRAYGDLFVRRSEGATECQAARRDTATGEFTELTPSFDIRRQK